MRGHGGILFVCLLPFKVRDKSLWMEMTQAAGLVPRCRGEIEYFLEDTFGRGVK